MKKPYNQPQTEIAHYTLRDVYLDRASEVQLDVEEEEDEEAYYVITNDEEAGAKGRDDLDLWK